MAKLPKQLYVTGKKQPVYENGQIISHGPVLGFLHPWNPNKPDDKKHETQREWAYKGYLLNFNMGGRNGHLWVSGKKWEWNPAIKQRELVIIDGWADPQPQIWDNDPLPGFKIERFVSRWSTSNKLWRIADPRGYEFEITTACLDEIINNATILKGGIIDAKCAWMANKNLVVV